VSRLLAPVATVFAIAWVTLVVTAPQLSPSVAAFVYAFGSLICHQRPERSFHLAGAQLPVCARCLGIYAGVAIGLIVNARRILARGPAVAIVAAALPTIVTLVSEWAGLWNPGNPIRAAAGTILGAGMAAVVVTLHYDECTPRRPIASSPRQPPI
jgi:uncharacterized membrane protein